MGLDGIGWDWIGGDWIELDGLGFGFMLGVWGWCDCGVLNWIGWFGMGVQWIAWYDLVVVAM